MGQYKEPLKKEWISQSITTEVVEWCERYGKYLSSSEYQKALTTSQIRKFFGEVKRIEQDYNQSDVTMLKPYLAYAVGRSMKNGRCTSKIESFYEEMSTAISAIDNKEKFKIFVKIFEAIVAYHKEYGGQENGGK